MTRILRPGLRLGALLGLGVALLSASAAKAQLRRATSPVSGPPVSITAPDDALAMSVDPAALAFLSGWSLAYVHADADPSQRLAERGDGLYGATPLLLGFSLGASIDDVRPPPPIVLEGGFERTTLSLGIAYRALESLGVGVVGRVLFGPSELVGLFTLDLALSFRPLPELGLSLVARDVTGPSFASARGAPAPSSVPRSFLLGLAIRPTGERALTLDVAGVVDERGRLGARAGLELEVPYVGRVLGALELEGLEHEPIAMRGTVGLAIDWGQVGVGGGVIAGEGLASPGYYVTARLEEDRRRGVPTGDVIADVTLEGLNARTILATERRLELALHDPRVRGVLLRVRGSGLGLAYAEELRQLVDRLEDADKPVVCSLEDASGSELYACAGASRVVVDPAGGVRLYGPSFEVQHYARLLRELGVRADFVRIGRFKSAIEDYQDDAMSAPAREERAALLGDLSLRLRDDLARDRGFPLDATQALLDQGPYLAAEAVERGLVDAVTDTDELRPVLEDVFGGSLPLEASAPGEVDRHFAEASHIGVVVIDGELSDGENLDVPLLEIHTTGGRTASRAIDRLAADPAIAVIVVRIDSPGGSVLASDQIHRAILRARRHKPVLASMGAVAASGGYYVAAACDEIWAEPATITGSIGVWFGKVDFEPILTRYGVTTEQLSAGAHGGAESLFRPFSPSERALLADAVRSWYRTFLERVAEGRSMRVEDVHALAEGRVYSGDRALDVGLVDHLGGFASALVRARTLGRLPRDAGYELWPRRPSSITDYLLAGIGLDGLGLGVARAELADGLDDAAMAELSVPARAGGPLGPLEGLMAVIGPSGRRVLRLAYVLGTLGGAQPLALLPMELELR